MSRLIPILPSLETLPPSVEQLALYAGVRTVVILNGKELPPTPPDYSKAGQLGYSPDEPIGGLSVLGTPVYSNLKIYGFSFTDNQGNLQTLPNDQYGSGQNANTRIGSNNGHYQLFDSVLITLTQPIRVVKTEIQGRDGTVKEYIGKDDAQLVINIGIFGKNGVYPASEVQKLKRWLDAPLSKKITAWWLNDLGINNIVVTDYTMPQVEGGYSYQLFSINAISDAPVEVPLIQPIL
jgi:hypothetical protein